MAKKEEPKAAPAKAAPVPVAAGARGKVPVEAAPVEEKKPKKEKKSQKERPHSKKKHKKVQIWKLYKMEGGKLIRKNEQCPRCGSGTFLAKFKTRKYCGKCGWAHVGKTE